jgi:hypothetical protein
LWVSFFLITFGVNPKVTDGGEKVILKLIEGYKMNEEVMDEGKWKIFCGTL